MSRAAVMLRAGAAAALTVLTLLGTVSVASAHAQLVASVPGAGERLDATPTQVVLVFSERLDPLGTSIDVLDEQGKLVATGGQIDPGDPRTMTIALPELANSLYTVNWRSLSADDGHNTQGFFNFGVGNVTVPGVGTQSSGNIHAGHGLVQSVLETIGRILSELGAMLAFGLALVLAWVVTPTSAAVARRFRRWPAWALLVGGVGAAIVLPTAASSAAVDPVAYALTSDSGRLLLARIALGCIAGGTALVLDRRESRWMLPFAAGAGIGAAALLAGSGHAAGFDSLAPIVIGTIHITSAGTWFAGLVVLSAMALSRQVDLKATVRPMIPRFTGVALVAAALFVLSGIYLWWLVNRAIVDLSTDYSTLLGIKALLVFSALLIGAVNFAGWRDRGRLGPLTRIPIEAMLALAAVGVTSLVASGSPPGPTRPVQITQEASSAAARLDATLAVVPARPGPNQLVVNLPAGLPTGGSLVLVLDRLDEISQTTLTPAQVADAGPGSTFTADAVLPPASEWDASVRVTQAGTEIGRARFGFSFASDGALVGGVRLPIDPLIVLAVLFGALAVVGLTVALAGGWLPRANPQTSRCALYLGSGAAIVAAVLALIAGPQL